MNSDNVFPSQYPILCCVMTGVCHDLKLAIAVHQAGAMPSLIPYNLEKDITFFKKITKTTDIVVSVVESKILDLDFVNQLIQNEIKFIELLRDDADLEEKLTLTTPNSVRWTERLFLKNISYLKDNGIKIMHRSINNPIETFDLIDIVCVKGKESAGFASDISIEEQMEKQKIKTPSADLVTYGGISSPADVQKYLKLGAKAVGVGTLFAASIESCLDIKTKELMVSKTKKDTSLIKDTKQNVLIINQSDVEKDKKFNRPDSLQLGIAGRGGHIYAGHSLDGVTEIRTVKQTVEYLICSKF